MALLLSDRVFPVPPILIVLPNPIGELMQRSVHLRSWLPLYPDPLYFEECFAAMSCTQLLNIDQNKDQLEACIDIDPTSVSCEDSQTLILCSNHGVCTDVDCPDTCGVIGTRNVGCGESQEHDYPVCKCAY